MESQRLERNKKVLRYLKNHEPTVKVFSGEKNVTIDAILNCQNDWYLMESTVDVLVNFRAKYSVPVIVWVLWLLTRKKFPNYSTSLGEKSEC